MKTVAFKLSPLRYAVSATILASLLLVVLLVSSAVLILALPLVPVWAFLVRRREFNTPTYRVINVAPFEEEV